MWCASVWILPWMEWMKIIFINSCGYELISDKIRNFTRWDSIHCVTWYLTVMEYLIKTRIMSRHWDYSLLHQDSIRDVEMVD